MTGNSMKSDLLVESRNHRMTTTTDGRQQGLAIPGHANNNSNNNNSQTIGISSTTSSNNSNNSTNNTSSSSSNTRIIMSHILASSVENGDLAGTGIGNNVGPDLTLAIQENLKYGVGLSGLGRELLSRDSRPHPVAATSSFAGVSEGIRGSSSSISITTTTNNNNTTTSSNNSNTNTTTITTTNNNNNNNNGLYENGSASDGMSLLPPPTTEDTRGNVTNMTPSLYIAFTNPTTTSGSSTSSSTITTGTVTTINSYNNNNNHNGTTAHPTSKINTNNNSITNTTSPDPTISTSGGCADSVTCNTSSNNIHNNTPVFISSNNNNNNNTGGTSILPLDHYSKQCQVVDTNHENKLKELLLLHIDFIHHQQDLLLQKDREIGDLKSENETLKCRLDRMERRLSILKQKGEPVNSHHHHHHHHHTPKNQASSEGLTGDRGNKKCNFLKRRERKFGVDAQNVQKKKGSETTKSKTQSLTKNKLSSYRSSSDSVNRCQELSENGDVILRTDNLYYVSYYEPPLPSEKLLVNIRHTNDEINPDGSKEIPHWRLRPVANCYTLEGTENLEDEVFTKRHQKPELEEKRRKRWDLQRMREQKLFERLRERGKPYPDNIKDEPQLLTSFYPSLDDITHIEIADKVPVTAFGHPIPYIKPTDFELPWELGEWPSTSSSSGEDNRHQKHRRVKRK